MMDVLAGGKRVGQRLASRRVAERKKGSTTKVDIRMRILYLGKIFKVFLENNLLIGTRLEIHWSYLFFKSQFFFELEY